MSDNSGMVLSFQKHIEKKVAEEIKKDKNKKENSNHVAEYNVNVRVAPNNKVHARFITMSSDCIEEEQQVYHMVEITKALIMSVDPSERSDAMEEIYKALKSVSYPNASFK